MPIPTPNKLETESSFMSRCVSFVMGEGTPQEQAVAICSSQYRQEKVKTLTWKTIDRKRASYLPYAKTQFKRALKAQANEYLDKVKANGISEDYEISSAPIEQAMRNVYRRVMVQFARDTYNDLIKQANKTERNWADWVDTWFDDNVIELPDLMTNTTSRSIRKIAKQSIIEGWTLREFQNNLMSDYAVSERRAELIGRTEIIRASNAGSLAGAQETNIPMRKFWLSTRDDRTRGANPKDIYDHFSVDENKGYPLEEAFRISGELLMHPGDRSNGARPGNTINCRCTLTYQVIEEEEGEVYIEESVQPTDFASKEDFERRWHEEYPWDNDKQIKNVAIDTKNLDSVRVGGSKGAYYFRNEIEMSKNNFGARGSKRTWHHEYGHAIDFQFEDTVSKNYGFPNELSDAINRGGFIGKIDQSEFAFSNLALQDAVDDYALTVKAQKKFKKLRGDKNTIFYDGYEKTAESLYYNNRLVSYLEESFDNGLISFEELLAFNGATPEDFALIVNRLYEQDVSIFKDFASRWIKAVDNVNDGFKTRYLGGFDSYNFLSLGKNNRLVRVDGNLKTINLTKTLGVDLAEGKLDNIEYYTLNERANLSDYFGSLSAERHIMEGHGADYYYERAGTFFTKGPRGVKINKAHLYEGFANHIALRASDLGPLHMKVMNIFQPNVQNKFIQIVKVLDETNLTNLHKLYEDGRLEEFAEGFVSMLKKIDEVGANAYVDDNYIISFMNKKPSFSADAVYSGQVGSGAVQYATQGEFLDKLAEIAIYSPESYYIIEGFKTLITLEQYRRLLKYMDTLIQNTEEPDKEVIKSIINEYPGVENKY